MVDNKNYNQNNHSGSAYNGSNYFPEIQAIYSDYSLLILNKNKYNNSSFKQILTHKKKQFHNSTNKK